MSNQPRCSCGAYAVACRNCGAVPREATLFDKDRQAERDRSKTLIQWRGQRRMSEGRFIDECLTGAAG